MKLSIIIPVFNEEKTIEEIIKRVTQVDVLPYEKEIIVVNDGSNDGTEEILENLKNKFNFILLQHSQNSGKGAAIKTALKKITGDLTLIQDADLEYNPQDYQNLLSALDRDFPVVYGSRKLRKTKRGYFFYYLGGKFLTTFFNIMFGSNLTDVYTGYKLFSSNLIKSISLESRGFEVEAEITTKIIKKSIPIKEIAISYQPRKIKEGKKIRFWDGLIGIWTIIKYWIK